ncbi:Bicarbonate transport system permease protein CmpB [Variovorax sp. PBL-H6]|uniref:ABC transporter permease n=1 Tax=Variovorax sp. PBL-H6 TaxID=434009 RepID=UPI001319768F|nr:ABC transporter permease [Variovorax sp. PBL-H6]VTU16241.1 Bicarbonate transport system permease protein CmpB [Variovorax sp. PBL-H6]
MNSTLSAGGSQGMGRLLRRVTGAVVLLCAWEYFARSGMYSPAITPPLAAILQSLGASLADGSLARHTGATLLRVFVGMGIATAVAVPMAVLMGRYPGWENLLRAPLNVLLPIPSLAWVPLVVLWFGIGNTATVAVVVYAALFPLLFNVWMGVRAVNPLWLRAATVMNAGPVALLVKVVMPGTLPYLITGLRLSFGRAWIAVIGGELLASPEWGLGKVIFDAKEFLNASVMLAALLLIGILGVLFERFVFQRLEAATIERWGMGARRE